jgi:hypothetical protein
MMLLGTVAVLTAVACGSGQQAGTAPAATEPAGQATTQSTAAKDSAGPVATPTVKEADAKPTAGWADIPVYPGSKQVQGLTMTVPSEALGDEYEKVEWRYYTTNDAVDKVSNFFKAEMPKKGWKETGWMAFEGMAMGIYENAAGDTAAGVWVGKNQGENVTSLGVWRAEEKE